MWGALLGFAGTAAGGLMSYFNNKKAQRQADAEAARQQAYYQAKANENPLSRSENQHLLGQYDREAQQQIENARGVAAITGATPEYGLAVQKAVANGRADLMGNMAAGASERADKYNQLGEEARHQKAMDDQARIAARNETFANLAANAANIVGSSIDGLAGAKKAPAAEISIPESSNTDGNASKLKSATPPPTQSGSPIPHQNPVGTTQLEADAGFVANADGTYTRDGKVYVKGWDNTFRLKQ